MHSIYAVWIFLHFENGKVQASIMKNLATFLLVVNEVLLISIALKLKCQGQGYQ